MESRILTVLLCLLATAGCGDRDVLHPPEESPSTKVFDGSCTLGESPCEATAGYLILEDSIFLNEPGPHTRLLVIHATDDDPGGFIEFLYSGEITSGEYQITLNDPFDGGRTTPPTLTYVLPENHPSYVDVADDWRTGGEVFLVLDFDGGEFLLEFGPTTFLNFVEQDKSLSFDKPSRLSGSLTANCRTGGLIYGTADSPFCQEELSKLTE